jgi:ATP-dependent Clp protease ATP-binding subunit ClpA
MAHVEESSRRPWQVAVFDSNRTSLRRRALAGQAGNEALIEMTWEELIAKAEEHAKAAGISADQLHRPKVRETALVSFISKNSAATAKFHLDATTGELINAEFSGSEFTPKRTGKQLSQRAQGILQLASEESKRMGCEHVGSDHLLLGLLVDGQGIGAAALSSAGLTAEAVRSRIIGIGCTAEVASNGYGPSMRNVLQLSSHQAEALGAVEIEPEHFVLGLLDRVDGPAMSLFLHFAVDTDRVKASLLRELSGKGR